ncbi:MAG: DUF1858 domain-containing protein [bacterium]|nr:DUF1858 domain-containing protein [bacterium]
MPSVGTKVTKDTVIGDVLQICPAAEPIIAKYFGTGCFTCPGIKMESLAFGAMMHNTDPEILVNEINALIEKKAESSKP